MAFVKMGGGRVALVSSNNGVYPDPQINSGKEPQHGSLWVAKLQEVGAMVILGYSVKPTWAT